MAAERNEIALLVRASALVDSREFLLLSARANPGGLGMSKPAWLHAIALSLVTSLAVCTDAAWGQRQTKEPDRAMIEAWVQAGGRFGWMRVQEAPRGGGFLDVNFREGFVDKLADSQTGEILAFLFKDPAASRLAALPISKEPFGLLFLNADEAVLKAIAKQRQLKILDLKQTTITITDRQLTALAGLRLRALVVGGPAKTDLGLKHYLALLEAVPTHLDLSGWKGLTDAGLKELTVQPKLQALDLSLTAVTDAGLGSLSTFSQLKSLTLNRTAVKGDGLRALANLPQLESLSLWGSQVTDDGLKNLAGLTRLRSLNLANTQVTDAGVESLRGLAQLRSLNLLKTQITEEGLKKLGSLQLTNLVRPAPSPRPQEDDPTKRCVGDACKVVTLHLGVSAHSCITMVNKGSKPVKVEYMIHGGKGAATILPGKDARAISPMGCFTKMEQLGTYWANYAEVAPENKGVQGCIPTATGGCAQPSR